MIWGIFLAAVTANFSMFAMKEGTQEKFQAVIFDSEFDMSNMTENTQILEELCNFRASHKHEKHLLIGAQSLGAFLLPTLSLALCVHGILRNKKLNPATIAGFCGVGLTALYFTSAMPWLQQHCNTQQKLIEKCTTKITEWQPTLKTNINALKKVDPESTEDADSFALKLRSFFSQRARLQVLLARSSVKKYDEFKDFRTEVRKTIDGFDTYVLKKIYNNKKFLNEYSPHVLSQQKAIAQIFAKNKDLVETVLNELQPNEQTEEEE